MRPVDENSRCRILSPFLPVGRKAGSVAGFAYSRAVKQSNIVWDAGNLDSCIADTQKAIPGNHMPFSGLPDAAVRADIVACLATLH